MSDTKVNPTKVVTGLVRFSYCYVFKPRKSEDGEGEEKYSVCVLIPKTDKQTLAAIKLAIDAAKEAGKSKLGGKIPANLKIPIRDGDAERPDDENYAGMFFFNASSKGKPDVVNQQKQRVESEDEFYSGCYGRVSVNFYAFATKGNKGIAAGLNNILKVKDGERLAGKTSADEDFKDFFTDDFSAADKKAEDSEEGFY